MYVLVQLRCWQSVMCRHGHIVRCGSHCIALEEKPLSGKLEKEGSKGSLKPKYPNHSENLNDQDIYHRQSQYGISERRGGR